MVKERNYALLAGLSIYLVLLTIIVLRAVSYINLLPEWLASNSWPLFLAYSGPILAIIVELSGLFRGKPQEFIAAFVIYLLAVLAIDFFVVTRSSNSSTFMFIMAGLIMLIYLLAMKIFFPKGEHFLIPVAIGFVLSTAFFDLIYYQGTSSVIGALWVGGWGIIMAGGLAALGHYRDRSPRYALTGMAVALLAIMISFWLTIMTIGY